MSASPVVLSVIVPLHNEAGNVLPLIAEIHAALRTGLGPYEIICVDDASTDETWAELTRISDPAVRVLVHRWRCGQSQAILTGAAAARADWIATLDGDGQNDPADLRRLLAALSAAGPPGVHTLFIGQRSQRRDGRVRVLASRIANTIRRALLNDDTRDSGCGMKLLHRDLLLSLPRFDAQHRFMPALVLRAGGRVVPVPIGHRPRLHGRSNYGLVGRGLIGLVDLLGVFWLLRRHSRPELVPPTPKETP